MFRCAGLLGVDRRNAQCRVYVSTLTRYTSTRCFCTPPPCAGRVCAAKKSLLCRKTAAPPSHDFSVAPPSPHCAHSALGGCVWSFGPAGIPVKGLLPFYHCIKRKVQSSPSFSELGLGNASGARVSRGTLVQKYLGPTGRIFRVWVGLHLLILDLLTCLNVLSRWMP